FEEIAEFGVDHESRRVPACATVVLSPNPNRALSGFGDEDVATGLFQRPHAGGTQQGGGEASPTPGSQDQEIGFLLAAVVNQRVGRVTLEIDLGDPVVEFVEDL